MRFGILDKNPVRIFRGNLYFSFYFGKGLVLLWMSETANIQVDRGEVSYTCNDWKL